MALPPHQILRNCNKRFRSYEWGTHRHTDRDTGDLISLFLFLEIRLKMNCVVYSKNVRSRGSSVSIVSDYGLDDQAIEVRSPARPKDFSSSLCV
jgi:hypothetical protein